MERVARIELASTAWKAVVLPLHNTRINSLRFPFSSSEQLFYHTFFVNPNFRLATQFYSFSSHIAAFIFLQFSSKIVGSSIFPGGRKAIPA